jgi:ferredoxin/flavodoxin---NADP+ reductase
LRAGTRKPPARAVFTNKASNLKGRERMTTEKHLQAKVVDRRNIADDLFTLYIEPSGPFSFLAGQYATLGVEKDGKLVERPYSIVSSPYHNILEIFIEYVPHGELTPLLNQLQKESSLWMRRLAKGRFTLDLRSGRKHHFLLSTVTGVAPYVSYIRTLYADWKKGEGPMPGEHKLYCIQGASRGWEFGYRDELERVAGEVPWLKYVATASRPWEDANWQGETGRVDDLIRKYASLWNLKPAETTGYLCGHPNMIENGRGILQRAGWKKDTVFEEVYFTL